MSTVETQPQGRKRGRKAVYGAAQVKTSVALPEHYLEALKRAGDGNLSEGIRRLVRYATRLKE